jgi:hypothetical protein
LDLREDSLPFQEHQYDGYEGDQEDMRVLVKLMPSAQGVIYQCPERRPEYENGKDYPQQEEPVPW